MIGFQQFMDWQGKMLGRYRLIRLLGRGGMGEVWLAEDTQLRRQVAAKLLPSVTASDRNYLQDFEHEARTVAALEHPHILPVHDFGDQALASGEIVTYLIVPYISGGSLREHLPPPGTPLALELALRYLRQAGEAIDYAHQRRVLHRDIKPANMLLQDDWLFLADFGIAKLQTSATRGQTHAGAGTPEFMAPEQVQGRAEAASDRYSLAVIAYLFFTGRLPFKGETAYETLLQHITTPPPSLRQFQSTLPLLVEQAIMQGLAKRPEERPPTCAALVNAIEQGWQIQRLARDPSDPESTMLAPWNKEYQEQLRTLSQGLTTPDLGQTQEPTRYGPEANPQQTWQGQYPPYAPAATHQAASDATPTAAAAQGYMTPAVLTLPDGNLTEPPPRRDQGSTFGRRAVLIGGVAAAVALAGGTEIYFLTHSQPAQIAQSPRPAPGPKKLVKGVPLLKFAAHSSAIFNGVWDPTGRYLATAGEDTRIMVWDVESYLKKGGSAMRTIATPFRNWKTDDNIYDNSLSWSPDGRFLVAMVGIDKGLWLYDVTKVDGARRLYPFPNEDQFSSYYYSHVAWSPNGNTFVTAAPYGYQKAIQIHVWQGNHPNAPVHMYTIPPAIATKLVNHGNLEIFNLSWSIDGTQIASLTNSNQILIWQAQTGTIVETFDLPDRPNSPNFVLRSGQAWSATDPHVLSVIDNDLVTTWDVPHKKLLFTCKTNDKVPYGTNINWSPNGKYLAGGYAQSPQVYIWEGQGTDLDPLKNPRAPIHAFGVGLHNKALLDVQWSPDGRYIASSCADATSIIWRVDAS